jgi:hypothetical protein
MPVYVTQDQSLGSAIGVTVMEGMGQAFRDLVTTVYFHV